MATKIKGAWLNDAQCPICQKNYTLEEIFIPKPFFEGDREEIYECEECATLLKIDVSLKLRATPIGELREDETEIILDEELVEPEIELEEE